MIKSNNFDSNLFVLKRMLQTLSSPVLSKSKAGHSLWLSFFLLSVSKDDVYENCNPCIYFLHLFEIINVLNY